MTIESLEIEDVKIITPKIYKDERGYFFESFSKRVFNETLGDINFVQDNESKSCYGVVRGLHFQKAPFAQAKLIRCLKGRILDVSLDIREDSKTYGQFVTRELSEETIEYLYIPIGFAHGFSVLSPEAIIQYKSSDYYHPEAESGIYALSPELGIDWKIPEHKMILSPKDKVQIPWKDSNSLKKTI